MQGASVSCCHSLVLEICSKRPPTGTLLRLLSQSMQAATAKYTDWVAYKHQTFIPHSSGGWKSELRMAAWSDGNPLPGL